MYTVKGFMKIELQDNGGGVAAKTTVEQVSGISEAFSNASAKYEAGLVTANKGRN